MLFPGGGIDAGETPSAALMRETMEETGAIVYDLKDIGVLHFDWSKDWAKTAKQKSRYDNFLGEEMHFFIGLVKEMKEPRGDPSDAWKGEKMMKISKAIEIIESEMPFSKDIKDYRKKQLEGLKILLEMSKRLLKRSEK